MDALNDKQVLMGDECVIMMCGLCSLASSRLHFRVQQNLGGSYAMSKLHRGLCRKSDDFSLPLHRLC